VDCGRPWFLAFSDIKERANLHLPLNVQKLEVFQLQGDFALSLISRQGALLSAYCNINTVSLLYNIVYHFWHLCDRVIVSIRSGKLLFQDWKSRGILLQKTGRKPIHNLPNGTVLIFPAAYRHPVAIVGETRSAGAVSTSQLFQCSKKRNRPAHCATYRCANRYIPGFSVKFLLSETSTFY